MRSSFTVNDGGDKSLQISLDDARQTMTVKNEFRSKARGKEDVLRSYIRVHLSFIAKECDNFEQTTHATMKPISIEGIAACIVEAYKNPNSHSIGDLRQVIQQFVEQEDTDE